MLEIVRNNGTYKELPKRKNFKNYKNKKQQRKLTEMKTDVVGNNNKIRS